MQPSDRAEFSRLITDVMAYYRQDTSRFVLDLWWTACQRFELEQVSKALSVHATDAERGVYAPKVADIVRVLAGTHTDRAQIAWGKVHEAMSAVGAYTDVVFDDASIHAVIEDIGGWPKVCRTPTAELGYLQHRFCESYKAYSGRGNFEYPRRLMGDRSPDHEYERHGLAFPKAAFVGDMDRARLVFQGGSLAGKTAIGYRSLHALAAAETALLPSGASS